MRSVTRWGCLVAAVAAVAAVAVAVGPTTTGPAAAAPPRDPVTSPVAGPVAGLLGQQQDGGTERRRRSDYGHTSARDGVLRSGCHDYRYRYVVTPPTGDWTVETFLLDRTGDSIASGTYF